MDDELAMASEEQKAYITFQEHVDSKLLATAGSGKTFCIIQHIKYIVQHTNIDPNEVLMLTFSKNARDDFVTKVKQHHATQCILTKNICTIDSFAYRMLGPEISKEIDISLLSFAWLDELNRHTAERMLATYPSLTEMKMIFVDEAQDLNEIQYNILMCMRQVCPNLTVHLIGDPNQNIFQFRKASDKYLVNFDAKTFHLTKNFRSHAHIVDFCSFLRPYNDVAITSAQPKKSLDITFYAYDTHSSFEHMLLSTVHLFQAKNIPLHKVAILAPTRGYMRDSFGVSKFKGLCYISNLLHQHKIPFAQFYNDLGANDEYEVGGKVKYRATRGHINLMTYTSSKGLEWDYVIIIDANAHLISRVDYDHTKFNAERYLLYVACSRPRKNLIVFTKRKYANPWFETVPRDRYRIAKMCQHNFDFCNRDVLFINPPNTRQRPDNPLVHGVRDKLATLTDQELFDIQKLLQGRWGKVAIATGSSTGERLKISEMRNMFAKCFFSHLYYTVSLGEPLHHTHAMVKDVANIINKEGVVLCPNEKIIAWYYDHCQDMTWDAWDASKSCMDGRTVDFVEGNFSRETPFNTHTLIDRYYATYIHSQRTAIQSVFNSYNANPTKPLNVLSMTRISYAIKSTHYFYIEQKDQFEKEFLADNNSFINSLVELMESNKVLRTGASVGLPGSDVTFCGIDYITDSVHVLTTMKSGMGIKDAITAILVASSISQSTYPLKAFSLHIPNATIISHTFDMDDGLVAELRRRLCI